MDEQATIFDLLPEIAVSTAPVTEPAIATSNQPAVNPSPVVKWAGGKAQLLPELTKRLPVNFNRYGELFFGGGALFWALAPHKTALINDINGELMNLYWAIANNLEELIDILENRFEPKKSSKDFYYKVRDWDRSPQFSNLKTDFARVPPTKRAARFLFLNKTCFNGLHRVNRKGQFNTPWGKYQNPTIFRREQLVACREALAGVAMHNNSYRSFSADFDKGDFVYLDPPYIPLSETANFTSYTDRVWDEPAHAELAGFCRCLDRRGVKFMLSNSDTPMTRELYQGFKIEVVLARRNVAAKSGSRDPVKEVVVRNY